jgi:ABC-type phosphate transport system substrate-binding protein
VAWLLIVAAGAAVILAEDADAAEELAVIANADSPGFETLSLPVLRQLYLGRRTRIGGRTVHCVDLPAGSPPRESFTRLVLGLSQRALDRYWLRQALSGGPPPPREVGTSAELMALVARQPGALGYVPWSALADGTPAGVRILSLEQRGRELRPGDPGYPLFIFGTPKP